MTRRQASQPGEAHRYRPGRRQALRVTFLIIATSALRKRRVLVPLQSQHDLAARLAVSALIERRICRSSVTSR